MTESQENGGPRRGRWPREDVAERLLRGEDVADADPRTAALARLLTAAARPLPGRPEHERAALDAFLRATRDGAFAAPGSPDTPVRPQRRPVRAHRPAKVLIGAAAAVFAVGGVAIAAQTGVLPQPFHSRPADPATPASGSPSGTAARAPGPPGGPGTGGGSRTSPAPSAPSPHGPSHIPSTPSAQAAPSAAEAKGLCEAYTSAAGKGRPADSSLRARLARAAGGADLVDSYCAALIATGAPATPDPVPSLVPSTAPGAAPGSPAAVPSSPAARQTARAGKSPKAHPTGSPTAAGGGRQK